MENMYGENFKYQAYFDKLNTPCPPKGFEASETIAFRWVFGDIDEERNFLPQYIKQPQRFVPLKDIEKCQALGLSVCKSKDEAKARFDKLKRRMLNRVYGLGTHLAKGNFQNDLGVSNLPDKDGHFTFHPYEAVVFEDHFEIIVAL